MENGNWLKCFTTEIQHSAQIFRHVLKNDESLYCMTLKPTKLAYNLRQTNAAINNKSIIKLKCIKTYTSNFKMYIKRTTNIQKVIC